MRIFGPMRQEATGECKSTHNNELHNLNSSPNITTVIKRMAVHVESTKVKKSFGTPRNR
jgi:hypothetical protein